MFDFDWIKDALGYLFLWLRVLKYLEVYIWYLKYFWVYKWYFKSYFLCLCMLRYTIHIPIWLPWFNVNYLWELYHYNNYKNCHERNCLHLITVQFQVVIPRTYSKYTSRRVLTTEWIDGEKLSQSKESNVGELVNVGVICYLKQVIYYFNAFSWFFTALEPVSFKLHLSLMLSFQFIQLRAFFYFHFFISLMTTKMSLYSLFFLCFKNLCRGKNNFLFYNH